MTYLGVDVGVLAGSPWLSLLLFGQGVVLALWWAAAHAAFGTRRDPVTRGFATAACMVLTVALMGSPVTVAAWVAGPVLVVAPALFAAAVLLWVVCDEWLHVIRVAYLGPGRRVEVESRVGSVLSQVRRRELEQRSSWWALDSVWSPPERVQGATDRTVRAIEGGFEGGDRS